MASPEIFLKQNFARRRLASGKPRTCKNFAAQIKNLTNLIYETI